MLKQSILFILFLLINYHLFGQDTISKPLFEPIPDWVKMYPKPKLKGDYDYIGSPVVHYEKQYNHINGEHFSRYFFYINNGLFQPSIWTIL